MGAVVTTLRSVRDYYVADRASCNFCPGQKLAWKSPYGRYGMLIGTKILDDWFPIFGHLPVNHITQIDVFRGSESSFARIRVHYSPEKQLWISLTPHVYTHGIEVGALLAIEDPTDNVLGLLQLDWTSIHLHETPLPWTMNTVIETAALLIAHSDPITLMLGIDENSLTSHRSAETGTFSCENGTSSCDSVKSPAEIASMISKLSAELENPFSKHFMASLHSYTRLLTFGDVHFPPEILSKYNLE